MLSVWSRYGCVRCTIPTMNEPAILSDSTSHSRSRIVVFAREPLLGAVKSRLASEIGPGQALAVYEAMLARLGALLRHSRLARWDLWVTSNVSHEKFLSICNKRNIYLQRGTDLGARMASAVQQTLGLEGVDHVLVLGTDCPALTPAYLDQALTALESGIDVVLGPAEDGGYVMVGMTQPLPVIFQGIAWGSDQVLQQTIEALRANQLSYQLLDTLWDVDRPEDLARLPQLDPPLHWRD